MAVKKVTKQKSKTAPATTAVAALSQQKVDPKEIEKAFEESNAETQKRNDAKAQVEKAISQKDKKAMQKRVDHVLKNPLVEVEVIDPNIPLEKEPISATAYDGLVDYLIPGTHLRLLCLADPMATPTLEQRVAMAKRLNEVGPYLPRYVKTVTLREGKGISKEDAQDSKDRAEAIAKSRNAREAAENASPEEKRSERRARRRGRGETDPTNDNPVKERQVTQREAKAEVRKSEVTDGVPLKKICAEVDIDPKDARAALRKAKIEKPGGRWEWPKDQVDEVKKILAKAKAELAKEAK